LLKPIRVLHVVGKMHRAGLETFIMNLYRNIDRTKIQFDFLTHYEEEGDYDQEIYALGGKIHRFSVMEDKNLISYLKELNVFFKKHKEYKIVHGHWATLGMFYFFAAKRNGVRYRIAHAHNDRMPPGMRGEFINFLIKPIKYLANNYFACSQPAIKWLYGKKSKVVRKNQVKIVNNAIDSEKFIYNKNIREDYRKKFDLEKNFIIGHIGRFDFQKNHKFIIKIFKDIIEKDDQAILFLIGSGPDMDVIKNQVKNLGLEKSVYFLGNRADIPELLSTIDLFLLPSNYEALGIVAIEAQAAGLPTVVSDAVPEEAYATELVKPLSLNADEKEWLKVVLKNKHIDRSNMMDEIKKSGYDINDLSDFFENFYLEMI